MLTYPEFPSDTQQIESAVITVCNGYDRVFWYYDEEYKWYYYTFNRNDIDVLIEPIFIIKVKIYQ